ncbi:hypothetical protein K466DRAFT_582816 [Polyporus arcularius HHB13444]|uniref:DUF6533 domain-containing protein n=1 Tax=Polyporus arcularius HHB13444 TaxID=1314778 RepID=A0A5C3PUF1_9APHY|nr:hypothetical protein K466DRAFT_582816 [Polyporus arcularius HHB13444]
MSSEADAAAATVALFDTLYTGDYCVVAASVLYIHDCFITFEQEVTCFWTAKRTGASFLFFANRWISMANYVMTLVALVVPFSCGSFQQAMYVGEILQLVPGAVFSALRAFVLSRSKLLGALVLALSLVPVGANLVAYSYQLSGANLPPFGCVRTDDTTAEVSLRHRIVTVISRVPLIVADMLLIYITWAKLNARSSLRDIQQLDKRRSLSDILFRDGTVLFILNVLHLVLAVTALAVEENGTSYVTVFTAPLTAILISRFLLDLQHADQAVMRLDPDDPLHSSRDPYDTPSFIASIGAFVNPDLPERSDDGLEWDSGSGSSLSGEHEGGVQATTSSRSYA